MTVIVPDGANLVDANIVDTNLNKLWVIRILDPANGICEIATSDGYVMIDNVERSLGEHIVSLHNQWSDMPVTRSLLRVP